jgi:hypothetical protein
VETERHFKICDGFVIFGVLKERIIEGYRISDLIDLQGLRSEGMIEKEFHHCVKGTRHEYARVASR